MAAAFIVSLSSPAAEHVRYNAGLKSYTMTYDRRKRATWMLACCVLMLALLACGGPLVLARQGALPSFEAELPIWPGVKLMLHSTYASACQVASQCIHQLKIQPALSVWLIWEASGRGDVETSGRRILYLPARE